MSLRLSFVLTIAVFCVQASVNGQSLGNKCKDSQTAFPVEPESDCCGQNASGKQKILSGPQTLIDQYPWVALFEYSKDGKELETRCGGALISGRYVLTAAHCVTGNHLDFVGGPPKSVRLGEFDTSKDGLDCVSEGVDKECNEGAISIPIEEIIVHPEFKKSGYNNGNYRHNIALVRLKESAPYSDFIRPICLPSKDVTKNPPENLKLIEAGWGTAHSLSPVKLHQAINYVDITKCQEDYKITKLTFNVEQFCAGDAEQLCRGSSGGPLMLEGINHYEVVGVDSFGPKICGGGGLATVYTNVFMYKDWIKSIIKA